MTDNELSGHFNLIFFLIMHKPNYILPFPLQITFMVQTTL